MVKWKVLSEKIVYEAKFFKVEEQKIEFPNGKVESYSVVKRNPFVIVFPVTESLDIYLVSQYRTLYKKNLIEGAAGQIDGDELPLDAAKRELKEETGLVASDWKKLGEVELSASILKCTGHIFLATKLKQDEIDYQEGEDIEILKMPLSEAVEKVISGEIITTTTITGILLIDKLRKEGNLNS